MDDVCYPASCTKNGDWKSMYVPEGKVACWVISHWDQLTYDKFTYVQALQKGVHLDIT